MIIAKRCKVWYLITIARETTIKAKGREVFICWLK
nr:MAG TPA: hypothetical protein [Caudoviricetes sp.]